jgi:predicted MFS family arabinose efflux permease
MMLLAFGLAGLTASGRVEVGHVMAFAAALGIASAIDMPTRQAFTIELAGRDDLMNAIALNSSIFNGARLVGPAVAGLLIAGVGEAAAFALNGLSFVAVLAALALMRFPEAAPRPAPRHPAVELREALSYLRGNRPVLGLVVMAAVPCLFGMPFTTLVPAVAAERLGLGASGFGLLISALGVGALVAALSLAALGAVPRKGMLLVVARSVFAASLAGFALSRSVPLSALFMALAGWGMITHLAVTNTLIQLQTPDALRGRVMGAYMLAVAGTAPLGGFLLGAWAEAWGPPRAILLGAAACAAGVVASLAASRGRAAAADGATA